MEAEEKEKEVTLARDKKIALIGNLVHDSVPISKDEVGLYVCVCMCVCVVCLSVHVPVIE